MIVYHLQSNIYLYTTKKTKKKTRCKCSEQGTFLMLHLNGQGLAFRTVKVRK